MIDDEQPDVSFVFSGTNLCWMTSFVDLHASIAEHMKIQNSNALSLPLAATASSRQSQSCRKIEHADAGGEHDLSCQTLVVCGPGWLLSCGRSIDQVSRPRASAQTLQGPGSAFALQVFDLVPLLWPQRR